MANRRFHFYRCCFFVVLTATVMLSMPACSSAKSGCPAEESRAKAIKMNKKTKKHSKTELFDKKMRKKLNH